MFQLPIPLCLALLVAPIAQSALVMSLQETGGDVQLIVDGNLDLTGLTFFQTQPASGYMNPGQGNINTLGVVDLYQNIVGNPVFGGLASTNMDSYTGDAAGVMGQLGYLQVPQGYMSGDIISGTATWNTTTLAGLSVTQGVYSWNWGSDSVTLYAGVAPPPGFPSPIPEPAAYIALAGFAGLGLFLWRRRLRG